MHPAMLPPSESLSVSNTLKVKSIAKFIDSMANMILLNDDEFKTVLTLIIHFLLFLPTKMLANAESQHVISPIAMPIIVYE